MTTQTRNDKGQFVKPERASIAPQFVPVWVALAVASAATILWGIGHGTGPASVAGVVLACGVGAALIVRSRTETPKPALRVIAAATVWAGLWSVLGPSWLLAAAGGSVWTLAWVPWWRDRYVPNTPPPAQQAPQVQRERTDVDIVLDRWNKRIAGSGTLAGTHIELVKTDGRVHDFLVRLRPGRQKYSQLAAAREDIASALEVPDPNIIIGRGEHAAVGQMTVITDIGSDEPVMYPGPRFDPETGLLGLGRYKTDGAEAHLSVVSTNGVFGATFTGDQGSGKTAAMEQSVLSLLASGYFVGLYVDPQGGLSSPALMRACKWTATDLDKAAVIIRQMPRWRRLRQILFTRLGWNGYTLSKRHPALLLILDEFQEVARKLSPEDQETLLDLAKTLRKLGGALFIGTQTIGLSSFGSNNDLRTQLMSRNVAYFYTSSKVQGRLSGNNEFDPSTLPSGTPGYGYLKEIRIDGKLVTRAEPFRAYHFGDKADFDGRNPGLVWAEKLQAEYEFAELPAEEVGAFGAAFAGRDQDRAASDEADQAFIEACQRVGAGELDPDVLDEMELSPRERQAKETTGFELPSARIGGADDYPEKAAAILAALRSGAWRPAEIERVCVDSGVSVSTSHIEKQLPELVTGGQAERVGFGHYHAAGSTTCAKPGCGG